MAIARDDIVAGLGYSDDRTTGLEFAPGDSAICKPFQIDRRLGWFIRVVEPDLTSKAFVEREVIASRLLHTRYPFRLDSLRRTPTRVRSARRRKGVVQPGHAQPGPVNVSHRAGGDRLLDQHDSSGQQGGGFLP